jgi:predicted acetyltransferase
MISQVTSKGVAMAVMKDMWHQRSRHTQTFVVPHHKPEQAIIVWKDVMFCKMFQRFGVECV